MPKRGLERKGADPPGTEGVGRRATSPALRKPSSLPRRGAPAAFFLPSPSPPAARQQPPSGQLRCGGTPGRPPPRWGPPPAPRLTALWGLLPRPPLPAQAAQGRSQPRGASAASGDRDTPPRRHWEQPSRGGVSMTTPFPPRGPCTRPGHRGATSPGSPRPPASRPPLGGYSLKPRRISLARSSVADMVLPRRAAGGRGWAGLAWLRGPGREGGGDSGASGPPHPSPLPPSLPRTRHWPAQPTRAASRRPAPRLAAPANQPLPPPRRPAFWFRKDGAVGQSDGASSLPAPLPHSRAAAQRSLRRTPRPSLTSPGDGSRRRTNLSRPLRRCEAGPRGGRAEGAGASVGGGPGEGRPRGGGVVEGDEKPPQAWSAPSRRRPARGKAARAVPELLELGWRFSSGGGQVWLRVRPSGCLTASQPSPSREFG